MTAIEWLEKRFYFTKGQLIDIDFEQAKAIEKEQKIEFANSYVESDIFYCSGEFDIIKDAEQYYNEIFKSE